MPTYIGKDGIKVIVLPLTESEFLENKRKWEEYMNSQRIKALRELAKVTEIATPNTETR